MAGNKISTKTKGKEDKGKGNSKPMNQSGEDTEETDFSLLRKPILTSITGFGQARKIFDLATEELKDLLSNECDLLYECKVCRNIFRSLANFLSHKRVYCKEKFNSSLHGHFIQAASTISELTKIKHLEQGYQESIGGEGQEECEDDERIPLTKDLTAIVEKISKNKSVHMSKTENPQLVMQKIPSSSVAVFQNVDSNESQNDNMRTQVKELDNILSRNVAVLQSDGKFKIKSSLSAESDNVIQISDDDDHDGAGSLKCKICYMQFSTQKTLKFHMKYKHVESRLVYPCPDCLEIFSTSWSVYRHLFKVHRKSAAQIRRLRESIQAKAFKMDNPPAFYEKRKNNMKTAQMQKITEEERLEQENQAWMDNMECDGELPRCGGCGRTFERRAALAAHTHTCPPRALARRATLTKRIEIQIRKDYNKGPPAAASAPPPPPPLASAPAPAPLNVPHKTMDANENKVAKEEPVPAEPETDARGSGEEEGMEEDAEEEEAEEEDGEVEEEDTGMEASEEERKSSDAAESPEKPVEPESRVQLHRTVIRLPFAHQTEKSNFVAFKQRCRSEINIDKLLCKRCGVQCADLRDLYDHVAGHLKWVRYACKLCNYRHYLFEKLPEHLKVVHKLKGDKDFYFSTVKAITGAEALQLCEALDAPNDVNDTSPDSRRPSRCSSDSSRLSDDSSSSSTRVEAGSRKRKLHQSKNTSKRRKELPMKVIAAEESRDNELNPDKEIRNLGENDSSTSRTFEENSSDMDDIDEKIAKRSNVVEDTSSVASRRPVRRKAKPKNEDFEYDLSNLLKLEAQGYRDSQSLANQSKTNQTKRKIQQDYQNNYDIANKDNCGALLALSKRAVDNSAAKMKTSFSTLCTQKEFRTQNIFVRPLLPKSISRGDKISPKKESNEDRKESSSPIKDPKTNNNLTDEPIKNTDEIKELTDHTSTSVDPNSSSGTTSEAVKSNLNLPSVVPIKFRRQSLEVIKNPIINKNISEFTKAGMKTKILVIKPINRNKDGKLKFQTIKLKDPNKGSSNEVKSSDQVVVVKVPKVDAIVRPVTDVCNSNSEETSTIDQQHDNTDNSVANVQNTPDNETERLVSKETNNDSNSKKNPSNDGNKSNSESITSQETSNINGESLNDNKVDSLNKCDSLENINTTV